MFESVCFCAKLTELTSFPWWSLSLLSDSSCFVFYVVSVLSHLLLLFCLDESFLSSFTSFYNVFSLQGSYVYVRKFKHGISYEIIRNGPQFSRPCACSTTRWCGEVSYNVWLQPVAHGQTATGPGAVT